MRGQTGQMSLMSPVPLWGTNGTNGTNVPRVLVPLEGDKRDIYTPLGVYVPVPLRLKFWLRYE